MRRLIMKGLLKLKSQATDATVGPILTSMVAFAIPLIITTLVQTLFHSVDMIVLRYTADDTAVASVGATSTITSLIVNTFIGISGGSKVLVARFLGAKDEEDTRKAVSTSIILAFVLGVIAIILGIFLSGTFLELTNCPRDCFDGAHTYLMIYFFAAPAILIYNFGSGILLVSGDSQRPLLYIIISGLTNAVLNLLLCLVLKEKVAAVAIATLCSQIVGAVLVLNRLSRTDSFCKIDIRHLKWSNNIFVRMIRLGLPMCLHYALFPIANLQMQSAINSFGSAAVAGNAAAINLEGIPNSITSSFSTAALTFMGQNIGAKKPDRVRRSFIMAAVISISATLVTGIVMFSFSDALLGLYVDTTDAVAYGFVRVCYILLPNAISAINTICSSGLQAFGYSTFTSLNSIFSVFVFRIIWMNFIYPIFPSYHCIFQCYLVSWLIMNVINIVFTSIIFSKYNRGRLTKQI